MVKPAPAVAGSEPDAHGTRTALLVLCFVPLAIRAAFIPFFGITYDEAAYAWTAQRLADHGGWFAVAGTTDLFFWPPLFDWLAALPITLGVDRIHAVRLVTVLLSSAIPPLLFLLVRRAGHGARAAWLAAVVWIVNPGAFGFSVVGQVETPVLAFVLLALVLLQQAREDGRVRSAAMSAAALAASVWLKETGVGLVPLFALFLWGRWKQLAAWGGSFAVLILPVLLPSFLPGVGGLFFEVTNELARWDAFSIDKVLVNLARIHGIEPLAEGPYQLAATLFVLGIIGAAVASAWGAIRRGDFALRFCGAALFVFVAFFAAFWKRFVYYALTPFVFAVPFIGVYLGRFRRFAWVYLAAVGLLSVVTVAGFTSRPEEAALAAALRTAAAAKPNATVAMLTPRLAEYVAEREGIRVRISPDDWVTCLGRPRGCVFDHDYLLGDDGELRRMFADIFCGPASPTGTCDRAEALETFSHMRLVAFWGSLSLYELHAAPSAR